MKEVKLFGGFANLDKGTFNIYEYNAIEQSNGIFELKVSIPVGENFSTDHFPQSNLNIRLPLSSFKFFGYSFDNFVIYSKDQSIVEDELKKCQQEIRNCYTKLEELTNTPIVFKGNVKDFM